MGIDINTAYVLIAGLVSGSVVLLMGNISDEFKEGYQKIGITNQGHLNWLDLLTKVLLMFIFMLVIILIIN